MPNFDSIRPDSSINLMRSGVKVTCENQDELDIANHCFKRGLLYGLTEVNGNDFIFSSEGTAELGFDTIDSYLQ